MMKHVINWIREAKAGLFSAARQCPGMYNQSLLIGCTGEAFEPGYWPHDVSSGERHLMFEHQINQVSSNRSNTYSSREN